jgi:hypothetical protein
MELKRRPQIASSPPIATPFPRLRGPQCAKTTSLFQHPATLRAAPDHTLNAHILTAFSIGMAQPRWGSGRLLKKKFAVQFLAVYTAGTASVNQTTGCAGNHDLGAVS